MTDDIKTREIRPTFGLENRVLARWIQDPALM